MAARLVGKNLDSQDTEKLFIAGLLHDIGKMLLSKHLIKYVNDIKILVKMREIPFDIAEAQVLGFNHCDAGAELANIWKLPELLVQASKFHHNPKKAEPQFRLFAKVIHVSDIIAYQTKLGIGIDGNLYSPDETVFKELRITPEKRNMLCRNIQDSLREFERALVQ
jgi:putative nucleotidyltransferase with HDIG domain